MSERDPRSLVAQPLTGRGLGNKLWATRLLDTFLLFSRGLCLRLVRFCARPSPRRLDVGAPTPKSNELAHLSKCSTIALAHLALISRGGGEEKRMRAPREFAFAGEFQTRRARCLG